MTLAVFQSDIVDGAGNVVTGATVTVRNEDTGALAALKADRDGSAGLDNPLVLGGDTHRLTFYVVGGYYRIDIEKDGQALMPPWRYVAIGTAAGTDAPVGRTRTHSEAGDAEVLASDQCLIIDKIVGQATTVTVPAANQRNGVDVIIKDGKGDADLNPITPTIDDGQLCDGIVGADLQITTPYGLLWMRPKPDGSGYIQMPSSL